MQELIGAVLAQASKVVAAVVDDWAAGRRKQAQERVERFVAATDAELEEDAQAARERLRERF